MIIMDRFPIENNIRTNFVEVTPDGDSFRAEHKKELPITKTGTTTVALRVKDGVVLATDNRATMGAFVANKNARKLQQIQPHIYMTIAGGVADAQYLIDLLKAETQIFNLRNGTIIGVGQTAKLLQNILYNNKGWFQVGHILGGYTDKEGGKLFEIEGYGSLLEDDYISMGSGSRFAIGVMETEWKEGLTLEEGMDLAVKSVRSAIIRDIASGNGIDVVGMGKGREPVEKSYKITNKALIENTFSKK